MYIYVHIYLYTYVHKFRIVYFWVLWKSNWNQIVLIIFFGLVQLLRLQLPVIDVMIINWMYPMYTGEYGHNEFDCVASRCFQQLVLIIYTR